MTTPRSTSVEERPYDRLFLDLDGTVYLDGVPIGPVVRQLNELRARGVGLTVLTNNTSTSKRRYLEKLTGMGLDVTVEDIVSPAEVAAGYLRQHFGPDAAAYVLGTPELVEQLAEEGLQHDEDRPSHVLVGFDKTLTYARLERACRLVQGGLPYYLTHIDLVCPTRDGPIPDCGLIAQVIEGTTGVAPRDHFGKPSEHMARYLAGRGGDRPLLAGDRLYTDIALGERMGIDTLLVFSGETRPEQVASSPVAPTHTAETLSAFLEERFGVGA
ncbi:MAG TPA: HAD-IIA family hydrolase [Deinococcales bacterium]|nr:HAD-IIA family hydrolase [Deinococcales bacterium]